MDTVAGLAIDPTGAAYVTGRTTSLDFPVTAGVLQTSANDGYVAKLAPDGSSLAYSTFLGGAGIDEPNGLAVDSSGDAFVVGATKSLDFPTTSGAFRSAAPSNCYSSCGFLAALNPTATGFVYSTFLGDEPGTGTHFSDVAVDSGGVAHVVFHAIGAMSLPVGGFQPVLGGGFDLFILRVSPNGSSLLSSTFLGGRDDGNDFS